MCQSLKSTGADTTLISFPRSPQSNILTKSFSGLYTWFKGLSVPREVIINGAGDGEAWCNSGRCEMRDSVNETWELPYAATRTHEGAGVFTSFTYSNTCEFIGTG